jgi:hypothetical protein
MNNALSFLNDLAQWLGQWVPRIVLVQPTHRGVLFGSRGSARELAAGLRVYWPIAQVLVLVPVTTQSVHLCSQMLPAEATPGEIIPRVTLCATAIQFRVSNAVLFATKALSPHSFIDNRTSAAVARHLDKRDDLTRWAAAVVSELRGEAAPFGIEIERLDFTGFATGVAVKNVNDWNYTDAQNGKRPE